MMRYLIYKVTNLLNNRYYIGRHSTKNIDDNYMGSGIGIINAIEKYGKENFKKEIIAEAFDSAGLWEIERQIVNSEVVNDPMSYNMAYGGKHYLHGLKKYDPDAFVEHQRKSGLVGGRNCYDSKTEEEKKKWHSSGGRTVMKNYKKQGIVHPFLTKETSKKGYEASSKIIKGSIELWSPDAICSNKNHPLYKKGQCIRVKPDSTEHEKLLSQGWVSVSEKKSRLGKVSRKA